MKKVILLAALMLFAMASTVFAIAIIDEEGNIIYSTSYEEITVYLSPFGSVTGEVVEIGELIRLKVFVEGPVDEEGNLPPIGSDGHYYVDFAIDMNTFIHGGEIAVGDTVTGFFDRTGFMILIYPPQYTALALVKHTDDMPRVILDRFDENWVSSNQNFRLDFRRSVGSAPEIYFQGGNKFDGELDELIGRKLLVEFTISHRDLPETIPNPQRITILYERAVPPIIDIDWDYTGFYDGDIWANIGLPPVPRYSEEFIITITINGEERGVPGGSLATVGDYIAPNYAALRPITESLGFTPEWDSQTREVTVNNPLGEIKMQIGSPYVTLTTPRGIQTIYILQSPPTLINGRTYVPFSFFTEVFGFTNAWWEGGTLFIDNAELMQ